MQYVTMLKRRTRTEVAESSFEFLHTEMIQYFLRQHADAKDLTSKLNEIGFLVGLRLSERYSIDKPRFLEMESLDIVKYLCKDLWTEAFNKQIDKLQTNYKGTYVLHDFRFRWLTRFSSWTLTEAQLRNEALHYTHFACGLIRGALFNLGMKATVQAQCPALPACLFTIVDTAAASQLSPGPQIGPVPSSTQAPSAPST